MSEEAEEWRPIAGYEGFYEVSSLGRIRSLDRKTVYLKHGRKRKGHVLKLGTARNGRKKIMLQKNRVIGEYQVHRLVAAAFCERPEGCDVVNHINNNPLDNRAANLEWTTPSGNQQHAAKHGRLCGTANPRMAKKLNPDIARMIAEDYLIKKIGTQSTVAKKYGVAQSCVFTIVSGKTWSKATNIVRKE
jgi:hypothetical protein